MTIFLDILVLLLAVAITCFVNYMPIYVSFPFIIYGPEFTARGFNEHLIGNIIFNSVLPPIVVALCLFFIYYLLFKRQPLRNLKYSFLIYLIIAILLTGVEAFVYVEANIILWGYNNIRYNTTLCCWLPICVSSIGLFWFLAFAFKRKEKQNDQINQKPDSKEKE